MATVDHVESGTITTATIANQSSITATLSTTLSDVNKTFLVFSGGNPGGNRPTRDWWLGEITNTTTLTFTRGTTGYNPEAIEWFVVEFSAGVTVQHVNGTSPTTIDNYEPLGWSIALTADTVESGLFFLSQRATDNTMKGQTTRCRYQDEDYVELMNGEDDTGPICEVQVVVYDNTADGRNLPGHMGYFDGTDTDNTYDARDTIDAAPSSSVGTAIVLGCGCVDSNNSVPGAMDTLFRWAIDDTDTVSAHRGAGTACVKPAWTWFQLFEWFDGTEVYQYTTSMTSGQVNVQQTITAITEANSIIVTGTQPMGFGEQGQTVGSAAQYGQIGMKFNSSTEVDLLRDISGYAAEITFFVIDFTDAS